MDKSGIIGEISENLSGVVKQSARQIAKTPVDLTKTGVAQVKGDSIVPEALGDASSSNSQSQASATDPTLAAKNVEQGIKDKQDLVRARQDLHAIYYQKLVNPQKGEEETVTEKLEREDKMKEQEDLQTQAEKPPALPQNVKQGTGEKMPGAG